MYKRQPIRDDGTPFKLAMDPDCGAEEPPADVQTPETDAKVLAGAVLAKMPRCESWMPLLGFAGMLAWLQSAVLVLLACRLFSAGMVIGGAATFVEPVTRGTTPLDPS